MNRRQFVISAVTGVVGWSAMTRVAAQRIAITPKLADLAANRELRLSNRTASRLVDGDRTGVRLSDAPGEGVALVPGTEFSNGTIEIDLRGKDVAQQSFIGIAFHGVDGATYDAIYFRPFNFRAADPTARSHAVQYHSLPGYGWDRLRREQPGKYEQAVNPVPDPNAWFHARVVVADRKVAVLVADAKEPCLAVNLLNDRRSGLLGLWVGNGSGGDFANLSILRAT